MIDVNVSLSRWPFRRLPYDDPPRLVEKLRRGGVTEAWAGSFDALLHRDIASVNARLADECRQHGDGFLVPFGTVHPLLPDWRDDLRRCREEHAMRGIRLFPNYHGYALDTPQVAELFELAASDRLIVQIAVEMEDDRTQHPLVRVAPVDPAPLTDLAGKFPALPIIVLNGLSVLKGVALAKLAERKNVWFDLTMLEGVGGIEKLIEQVPYEQVLFGSHLPFFTLEAAKLKLKESELGNFVQEAITTKNARGLVDRR